MMFQFNPYFTKRKTSNLKKVFNGHFPKEALQKMNRKNLEKFVLKLVECSVDVGAKDAKDFTGLCRSLCLKEINKPEWWPSERIITQSLTSDGKYFMELLRFLVYKCCEFFKKPSENLNTEVFVTENDENFRRIKRKLGENSINEFPCKRRTLMPKNATSKSEPFTDNFLQDTVVKSPVIRLNDILYKPADKSLTQDGFLNIFGLQNTFNPNIDDLVMPAGPSSSIKFNNCSVIPFSSDLGRELMKRDNHICPEALKTRKLERVEWYINKTPSRYNELNYEVSYQEKKDLSFRAYKFPKRQIWQHPGDFTFQKKALYCRRLKVVLVREDLEAMRKKSLCKMKIVVSRAIKPSTLQNKVTNKIKKKTLKCISNKRKV